MFLSWSKFALSWGINSPLTYISGGVCHYILNNLSKTLMSMNSLILYLLGLLQTIKNQQVQNNWFKHTHLHMCIPISVECDGFLSGIYSLLVSSITPFELRQ